ncbi:unnamed protein product [Rhodiola kirilowii]
MSKLSPLIIFIATTLLVSFMLTSAARPNPTYDVPRNVEDVGCEGLGVEACLEKTTLNAHTDYIYTQPLPPHKP